MTFGESKPKKPVNLGLIRAVPTGMSFVAMSKRCIPYLEIKFEILLEI